MKPFTFIQMKMHQIFVYYRSTLRDLDNWNYVISEKENVLRVSSAGQYLFANYLEDAKSKVIQFDLDGNFIRDVELPGIGSAEVFPPKLLKKNYIIHLILMFIRIQSLSMKSRAVFQKYMKNLKLILIQVITNRISYFLKVKMEL